MATTMPDFETDQQLGATTPDYRNGADRHSGLFESLRRQFRLIKRRSSMAEDQDSGESEAESIGTIGGLHEVIKGCDVSFGIEASQVERRALELASASAAASLPRMDVEYDEVAEETELAAQCRATFYGWVNRVRTKVQDALQHITQEISAALQTLEHEVSALESAVVELPARREELRAAERDAEAGRSRLEYRPYMAKWFYFVLIGLLVVVDWIANVPVFAELLPKDPFAEEQWRSIAANAEQFGLWAGLYRIVARSLHHFDASLLALGLIIVLVWIAHAFGESVRRLVAHTRKEDPTAALTIKGQRRQAVFPAVAAAACMAAVLVVLWMARERLSPIATQRVADVDVKIEEVNANLAYARASGDLTLIGRHEEKIAELQFLREQRLERADYAEIITEMNWPILFLNCALAITAALAAYLSTKGTVDGVVVSSRVATLRQQVSELEVDIGRRRVAISRVDTEISRQFARYEYLASSKPLEGWQAKAQRLEAVIPSFRSENARIRGVDLANIAAFSRDMRLNLEPPADILLTSASLVEYKELYTSLKQRESAVMFLAETPNPGSNGNGRADHA